MECFSFWGLSDVSLWLDSGAAQWLERWVSDVLSFSELRQEALDVQLPLTSVVNFEPMVEVFLILGAT